MSQVQDTLTDTDPWKDAATLRELYEGRTQAEVAEWFGERGHDVTGSTIAYWMKKLGVNTSRTKHDTDESNGDDGAECNRCGGETPGPKNDMCNTCLDDAREEQREAEAERRAKPSYKR